MGVLAYLALVPIILIAVIIGVKFYFKFTTGICKSKRRIDGQVAIVTGANSGIGYETAKELVRRGAKVIVACRDITKAQEACYQISSETGCKKVIPKALDLSSLKSVREFCGQILSEETRLDILVNNAGIAGLRKTITEEGLEMQFATNHFGPFLLTNILLELMKKTGSARIVSVSSLAHNWTKDLDVDNLNSEKKWEPKVLYAKAKLCNILFIKELARRLKEAKINGVLANAVNPGGVKTAIFRHAKKSFKYMIMVSQFFFKTPWEGAQPSVHLCVSEEVDGLSGFYWTNCKKTKTSRLAEDADLAKRVWDKTTQLVDLKPEEYHLK